MPSPFRYLTTLFSLQPAALAHPQAPLSYSPSPSPCPSLSPPPSHLPPAHLGAVASESSICSHVGTTLLQHGGSAADALVGTVFCTGVVGMYHSGIGGGGFMLVRDRDGRYEFIDFRETAPAAAFEDMYVGDAGQSIYGGLASGVPGEIRGLEHIHQKYGKLSWHEILSPAIKIARYGFPVTADLVRYMDSATSSSNNFLVTDPTWAIDFAPNGTRLGLGDTLTRKRYADTLERIALEGPDAFYTGAIANATIKALQKANGTMTLDDLANYTVAVREPVQITYRGYKLTSCRAPSSGSVALSVLKIVEGYDHFGDPANVNLSTHRLDEAMRFAYGESGPANLLGVFFTPFRRLQRGNLGDPSFVKGLQQYEESMLTAETAREIRAKISDSQTFNVSYYDPAGIESLETPGTSHVVAADESGMAVSLTTTVNLLFGSHLMVPETGVIMNNEMNDFSIPNTTNAFGYIPSPNNFIKPGKRPLSSISPVIAEHPNGSLYVVVGAAGGSRIITATVQSLWHILDGGLTTPEALAMPRLHDQLVPNQVSFEWSYDNSTVESMRERGHNVTWVGPWQSSVQAVRRLGNGTFEAAGEPRQVNSGGFAV
ncbi:gamma-glutamyltransferase 1 [Lepidopterella palustris CBS 459.81]|uniref:Glutathione hydrolase n=1 Tax=Lepidopterella palustris CBS 459.81 TaxID=1314670 RepID=A0A8E2JC89_9PEZI|nr:gamma-glutamyltransferase 1 [Lepidopterella palustris CBS 459.81]